MKIAIIGNANPENKDYGEQINFADIIVRFNKATHYDTGKIGSKCTVLVIQRLSIAEDKRFLREENKLNQQVVDASKEIWFLNYLPECMIEMVKHYNMRDKKIEIIDPGLKKIHEIDYYWSKFKRVFSPSTGIAAIHYILNEERFKDYKKQIYFFSHTGNNIHFWDGEENLLKYWASTGSLEIIP